MRNEPKKATSATQNLAAQYLNRDGLSFTFDAGQAPYDYHVAIGSRRPDVLSGNEDRDYFWGMQGDDRLSTGAENDNVYGGPGNDLVTAGMGEDLLVGGSGDDTLYGGAFDHIALVNILPEQVRVTDTAQGALVWWDLNGDSAADGSILLEGVPGADLRQSDFMFDERPAFVVGVSDIGSWYVFPA